jgi:nitroreductase
VSESQIGLFDAIYTQRAIRSYKSDPVPRELITKIVEAATKAPSGANSQPWAFIAVDDREKLDKLSEWAKDGFFNGIYKAALERMKPGDPMPMENLKPMIEEFEVIPCIIVVCLVRPEGQAHGTGNYSSIFPAVQNLLLAARGLGLGGLLSSGWAQRHLDEVKALLEMPSTLEPVAFIPIGYPDKQRYGKTTRRPVEEVLHWNGWEGDKGNSAKVAHR